MEQAAAANKDGGYEAVDLVKVVVAKNLALRSNLHSIEFADRGALRTVVGVGLCNPGSLLRVLDFGGGAGFHYTVARAYFDKDTNFQWNVVETPALVREADKMCNSELRFFGDIESAKADLGSVDLVFTSGALQFCEQPLSALETLLSIRAKHLFIARTPLLDEDRDLVFMQKSFLSDNGPGPLPQGFKNRPVFYPNVYVSRSKVEKLISAAYDIKMKFQDDVSSEILGSKNARLYGYFCSLK
jgi:putative methyltransferase (TIGR04325 family)